MYDGSELVSVTLAADEHLKANNVRGDVNIFGVDGGIMERDDFRVDSIAPKKNATTHRFAVPQGVYDAGDSLSVPIQGDSDLIAANIKKDVIIFGVQGTYDGEITSSTQSYSASDLKMDIQVASNFVDGVSQTIQIFNYDIDASYRASADAFCAAFGKGTAENYTTGYGANSVNYLTTSWDSGRLTAVAGWGGGRTILIGVNCIKYSE